MSVTYVRDQVSGLMFQMEQYEPSVAPVRLDIIPCPMPRPATPRRPTLSEPALWSHLLHVPNRLFGATITPEGDAT